MRKPLIGITLDSEDGGGYSQLPWYALRKNYVESVIEAGGIPLLLPHDRHLATTYAEAMDGLLITGGAFDVDPTLFGATEYHESVVLKKDRTDFEITVTREALNARKPILGICGGQQLLHVLLGGSLIQHIPDEIATPLEHEQPNPRTEPGHTVTVIEGTLLEKIAGQREFSVNSAHHQAAKTVGDGVVISAVAPDGVIEAIEYPRLAFCLGVQWHPEYHISSVDTDLFNAFIKASGAS